MEHTITIRVTDDNVTLLPEIDEMIAIAKKIRDECAPINFDVVFVEAMKVYWLKLGYDLSGDEHVHSQE